MASTVLAVGTGVFVIAIVWIVFLVFGMMLLRASVSAKLGIIPIFLLALTITLVLVFFPRSPETTPPFKETEGTEAAIYHMLSPEPPDSIERNRTPESLVYCCLVDTLFIGRYVLLAVVSAAFLVVFFMLLPFHFLEPVYAKALRTQ